MTDRMDRLNAALEGRRRIEREVGEGGMATVYLAQDLKHNRRVALKVLKPELAAVVGDERFIMSSIVALEDAETEGPQSVLVLNFNEELKARVPNR